MSDPKVSISVVTTYFSELEKDIEAYAAAGADGIGLWEYKLRGRRDEEAREAIRAAGLTPTLCCPEVPSILPDPFFTQPNNPKDRVRALSAAVKRLAAFDPVAILCVTGDPRGLDQAWARDTVVSGMREVAAVAADLGIVLGLEPYRQSSGALVTSLHDTAALVDEIGADNIKIIADVWHLWDLPDAEQELQEVAGRLVGVQVSDYRNPTRSWCDRLLPGTGVIDTKSLFRALAAGSYDGWFDVEVFSDNGRFGNAFPDSVWSMDPREVSRRAVSSVRRLWRDRDSEG